MRKTQANPLCFLNKLSWETQTSAGNCTYPKTALKTSTINIHEFQSSGGGFHTFPEGNSTLWSQAAIMYSEGGQNKNKANESSS